METEETGNWIECVVDNDFEINDAFPYPIRRKGTDKIINEYVEKNGYIRINLNRIKYNKHRIIAQQFLPNDDPINKLEIDHIDQNRANNHIDNLRWVSRSENEKNKS